MVAGMGQGDTTLPCPIETVVRAELPDRGGVTITTKTSVFAKAAPDKTGSSSRCKGQHPIDWDLLTAEMKRYDQLDGASQSQCALGLP